jgi:transcriptional regulator with XRE-family HTH domain
VKTTTEKEAAAKRLRELMKRQKMNNTMLSKRSGISPGVISRILSENRDFKVSTAVKLAYGLNISVDHLLGVKHEPAKPTTIEKMKRLVAQMDNVLWGEE